MKKITTIVVLASLCLNFTAFAQTIETIVAVKPGEHIPDLTIEKLSNYKTDKVQLADFKDKLLIIDFWATWCGTCVDALPKVEKLQKEFRGEVQILSASNERTAKIQKAFANMPILQGIHPVIVNEDTKLEKLFPHRYLPHIVWIRNGVYLGATAPEFLTAENIRKVQQQKTFDLLQKDDIRNFDFKVPLFNVASAPQTRGLKVTASTNISGYLPGIPNKAGHTIDSLNGLHRYYFTNHSILNLYAIAMEPKFYIMSNRNILNVRDPNDYLQERSGEFYHLWSMDHAFCAEITMPLETPQINFKRQLKTLLDNTFNLEAAIEERETDCLILKVTDPTKLKSVALKPEIGWKEDLPVKYLKKANPAILAFYIDKTSPIPVINEAGEEALFDLTTKIYPTDISQWREILKDSGFSLIPAKRRMEMFVLTERGSKNDNKP